MRLVLTAFVSAGLCLASLTPNCLEHDPDTSCMVESANGSVCVRTGAPACMRANGYTGQRSRSVGGHVCNIWNTTTYTFSNETGQNSQDLDHNYCRMYQIGQRTGLEGGGPWCKTATPTGQELCFPPCQDDQCYLNEGTKYEGMLILSGVKRYLKDAMLTSVGMHNQSNPIDACNEGCKLNVDCKAWTYGTLCQHYGSSELDPGRPHNIHLFIGVKCSAAIIDSTTDYETKYKLSEKRCSFLPGIEIEETDSDQRLSQTNKTDLTINDCCRLCTTTDHCLGYTWIDGACYKRSSLKSRQVEQNETRMIISGVVRKLCSELPIELQLTVTPTDHSGISAWVWVLIVLIQLAILLSIIYIIGFTKYGKKVRDKVNDSPWVQRVFKKEPMTYTYLPDGSIASAEPTMTPNYMGKLDSDTMSTANEPSQVVTPEGGKAVLGPNSMTMSATQLNFSSRYDVHLITKQDADRSMMSELKRRDRGLPPIPATVVTASSSTTTTRSTSRRKKPPSPTAEEMKSVMEVPAAATSNPDEFLSFEK